MPRPASVRRLGLRAFSEIIGPLFLAVVLSITVHPLRRVSGRFGLPAWIGMVLSLVAVYAIVLSLVVILMISGLNWPGCSRNTHRSSRRSWTSLVEELGRRGVNQEQLQAFAAGLDPSRLVDLAAGLLGGLAGVLSSLAFIVLLLFFTVTDAGSFALRLGEISPAGQRLATAFQLFAHGSRQYLAVATVFGAVVALFDFVALTILDIRYAWLWALLAFVTNYIPNIGFILGLIPPTILALLDHSPATAIAVVVIYCALNVVIQSVIQPRVVGSVVGLTGTLTFVSLVVWTTVIGPVGAVLAVPASLFVKAIFVDVDPERRWLTPLLSNAPDDRCPGHGGPGLRRTTPENRSAEEPAAQVVETTGSSRETAGQRRSVSGGEGRAPLRKIMSTPNPPASSVMPTCVKPRSPADRSGPPAVNHQQRHDDDQGDVGRCHGRAPNSRAKGAWPTGGRKR